MPSPVQKKPINEEPSELVRIDGSILEAGGQMLRNASAYACILGIPIQIRNIRLKRRVPGLKPQHLCGLQLLQKISGGTLEGGQLESREFLLQPGKGEVLEREFIVDHIAGSVCLQVDEVYLRLTTLVFQSALPVLLFADHETRLVLRGRTDKPNALAVDYTKYIFLSFLKRHFGVDCDITVGRRGISSLSEGEVFIGVKPLQRRLNCISLLERGEVISFTSIIWNAKKEYKNLSRALNETVKYELASINNGIQPTFIQYPPSPSETSGLGILLYAETSNGHRIAATKMLEITLQVEEQSLLDQVKAQGVEVVRTLTQELAHGGVVDKYLADQIIIFMALASSGVGFSGVSNGDKMEEWPQGRNRCEILVNEVSFHAQSAMRIAENVLQDIVFSTMKLESGGAVITCTRKLLYDKYC